MTTYAVAIPPSCESERWIELNPAASQAARTVPVTWKRGRPDSSLTTSASCQPRPGGAPSALAIASLAANLAARDWFGRAASAGVKSRSRRLGVRSIVSTKRATSTTSIPTPTITWRSLHGDGLGQVPRLGAVVAHRGGQLEGAQLARDGRDERRGPHRPPGVRDQFGG